MNWEKSKALTPLKRDFLKAFFAETDKFYLTGGSALGIFYLQHRLSYDLDFFTQDSVDWHGLSNVMRDITAKIDASLESITASPLFYRFRIARGDESEIIDFVVEKIPQIDPQKNSVDRMRIDTLREIGVNKIAALLSRCEIKDIVDLYFLQKQGFDIFGNLENARKKEGGFDPAMISFLLSQISLDKPLDYMLEPLSLDELRAFIEDLGKKMAQLAFPES